MQTNRSRSLWTPSLGPGIGPDRPSYAPGHGADDAVTGRPERWFDPTAFVLQPAGTFGNAGRDELIGPDLRTVDLSFSKSGHLSALGPQTRLEFRIEVFNILNRANFGVPVAARVRRPGRWRGAARDLRAHQQYGHDEQADAIEP